MGAILDQGGDIPTPAIFPGEEDVYWIEPAQKVAIPLLVERTS